MNDENLLNADIPEKFKDPETGEIKLAMMAKSYKELEQKLSQSPSAPKSPQEYAINCHHGMFKPDADVNERLHKKGFTQEQAQEVYDLAAEKLMPMMREIMDDIHADREVEKLINHFGGTSQWKEVSRQLLAFGRQNLPADVLDNMASSYEGVIALERMMKAGEPSLQKKSDGPPSTEGQAELSSMMRDPKYWRDKDPAFVEKVTQGFQSLYGK